MRKRGSVVLAREEREKKRFRWNVKENQPIAAAAAAWHLSSSIQSITSGLLPVKYADLSRLQVSFNRMSIHYRVMKVPVPSIQSWERTWLRVVVVRVESLRDLSLYTFLLWPETVSLYTPAESKCQLEPLIKYWIPTQSSGWEDFIASLSKFCDRLLHSRKIYRHFQSVGRSDARNKREKQKLLLLLVTINAIRWRYILIGK